jgi:hypothetical protein
LTDVIILDDFKTCLDQLRGKLIDAEIKSRIRPPLVPPKDFLGRDWKGRTMTTISSAPTRDFAMREKAVTATFNTARTSPTLVSVDQTPRTSPHKFATETNIRGYSG